jgi:hypothetical protein
LHSNQLQTSSYMLPLPMKNHICSCSDVSQAADAFCKGTLCFSVLQLCVFVCSAAGPFGTPAKLLQTSPWRALCTMPAWMQLRAP